MNMRPRRQSENTPGSLPRLGQLVFAGGMIWLGMLTFIYSAPVAGLAPVPAWSCSARGS